MTSQSKICGLVISLPISILSNPVTASRNSMILILRITTLFKQLVNCARYYNDHENALKYAKEMIRLRPDLINAKNTLAYSYLCLKQFDEAEKYYREMTSTSDQFESRLHDLPFRPQVGICYVNEW